MGDAGKFGRSVGILGVDHRAWRAGVGDDGFGGSSGSSDFRGDGATIPDAAVGGLSR